jgi:hypothetical protein
MKKLILSLVIMALSITASFGQLNSTAQDIKDGNPELYSTFKTFAERDWKGDHEMMVYTINKQAIAAMEVAGLPKTEDYDEKVLVNAMVEWVKDGIYDYEMVLYTYQKQIKAKNSY